MASVLYFFWISITVTIGLVWSIRRAHRSEFPLSLIFPITGWLLIVIPAGARLLHIFYEDPGYYMKNPFRVLDFWNGGFVYYGGLVAGLLFCWIFFTVKPRTRSFWETADFFTPVLCFGTGFGRVACFLQGCCYGKELYGFWSISNRHPTQLYQVVWEIFLLSLILFFDPIRKQLHTRRVTKILGQSSGALFLSWITLSAFGRFIIEFYRDDFRGSMLWGFSVSQIVALAIMSWGGLYLTLRLRASLK